MEPVAASPSVTSVDSSRSWARMAVAALTSFPVLLFAATRVAYLGAGYMGMKLVPRLYMHEHDRHRVLEPYPALDGLCRWDCGWFHQIAEKGYWTGEAAKVFPLLGVLGEGLDRLTGIDDRFWFIYIANAAALASFVFIYKIFVELADRGTARWGLTLFAVFPFAYYQAAGYPESLMILSSSLAIWLAMRNHHIWAGVVLGFGVMARHITLFAGVGMLVAQIRQRGLHPRRFLWSPAVLGLIVPFLFIGAFALYLHLKVGDPVAFFSSRHIGWNDWVWYGVRQTILYVPYSERPEYFFYIVFAVIPLVGTILLFQRKAWLELAAAGACLMLVILSTGAAGLGRYSASCWPAFLPLGMLLSQRPWLQQTAVPVLAIVQGMFFFLFTHQYRIF